MGGLTISEIQMDARSARYWKYFGLFRWEKMIFAEKWLFLFFSILGGVGGGGFWKV